MADTPTPFAPTPSTTADIVNEWFRANLASAPLARDTEAYNQVATSLPKLIASLDAADTITAPALGAAVPAKDAPAPAAKS